jgi:hypothetical protein
MRQAAKAAPVAAGNEALSARAEAQAAKVAPVAAGNEALSAKAPQAILPSK